MGAPISSHVQLASPAFPPFSLLPPTFCMTDQTFLLPLLLSPISLIHPQSSTTMSALRNVLARTVRTTLTRNAVSVRPAAALAVRANFMLNHMDRRTFATHLPNDFTHPDASLVRAQELVDEGASFHNNGMVPMAMSSFQKSINERPTGTDSSPLQYI